MKNIKRITALLCALMLCAALAACGGGGGTTAATTEATTTGATTTAPSTTEAATTGPQGWGSELVARVYDMCAANSYNGRLPSMPDGFTVTEREALNIMAPFFDEITKDGGVITGARMIADTSDNEFYGGCWGVVTTRLWDADGDPDQSALPGGILNDNVTCDSVYVDGRTGELKSGPSGHGRLGYTNQDKAVGALAAGDVSDVDMLRGFFIDYYGQNTAETAFLPDISADGQFDWDTVTRFAYTMSYRSDENRLSKGDMVKTIARYFPELKFEHRSSGALELRDDGYYYPVGWDYGGMYLFYMTGVEALPDGRCRVSFDVYDVHEGELVDISGGYTDFLGPNATAMYEYSQLPENEGIGFRSAGARLVLSDRSGLEKSAELTMVLDVASEGPQAWVRLYEKEAVWSKY